MWRAGTLFLLLISGCGVAKSPGPEPLGAASDGAPAMSDASAEAPLDAGSDPAPPMLDASVEEDAAFQVDASTTDQGLVSRDAPLARDLAAADSRADTADQGPPGRCVPVDLPPEIARIVVIADVDGDGHLDILGGGETGALTLRRGTGSRTLEAPVALPTWSYEVPYQGLVVRDFDGDGNADIGAGASGGMFTLRGLGQGQFGPAVNLDISTIVQMKATLTSFGFAGGDLDGDGHPDLVATNTGPFPEEQSLLVWWGKGDGTFGAPTSVPACRDAWDVHVVDVDGDGRSETFVICANGVQDMYRTEPNRTVKKVPERQSSAAKSAFGDVDQDGHVDMVSTSPLGNELGLIIRLGDGKGSFVAPTGLGPRPRRRAREVLVADFNGDGVRDLATTHWDSPAVSFLTGGPGLTFTASMPLPVDWNVLTSAAADLDEDGTADLVVARWGKGLTVFFGPCP
jgi:hypothetical protein